MQNVMTTGPDGKVLKWDRVLELEVIDGAAPISSTGLVDRRLFTGANKLHAIKDIQTCLWYLKYDDGGLPPALKQRFTSFSALMKHCNKYFNTRNIRIREVID